MRRSAAGFTLLELMMSALLIAIFFVAIFGFVWSIIGARDAVQSAAAPYTIGPVVLSRIASDLAVADLHDLKDLDGFEASSESVAGGDVARIDFVTAVPSRQRVEISDEWVRAAVNEVGYRLRRSETSDRPRSKRNQKITEGGGVVIVNSSSSRSASEYLALYRREDFGVDDQPKEGGRYYKLCDRVRRFEIDFFDEDPGDVAGDDAQGETDWDAKKEKKLPWGCRITLVVDGPFPADPDEAPETYAFRTFVAFRTRFDKPDGGAPTGNAPGGNNPGGSNPGGNNPGGNSSGGDNNPGGR